MPVPSYFSGSGAVETVRLGRSDSSALNRYRPHLSAAVDDITRGDNLILVAMGQSAKGKIAVNYELWKFPKSLDELDAGRVEEMRGATRHPDAEAPTTDN